MPRVVVLTEDGKRMSMNELVLPSHLDDDHHAEQFIERLAWGIQDAETIERGGRVTRE